MVNIYHDPVHFKLAMSGKGRIQMTDKEKDEEVVKMLLLVAGDVETNPGPMVSAFSSNISHFKIYFVFAGSDGKEEEDDGECFPSKCVAFHNVFAGC